MRNGFEFIPKGLIRLTYRLVRKGPSVGVTLIGKEGNHVFKIDVLTPVNFADSIHGRRYFDASFNEISDGHAIDINAKAALSVIYASRVFSYRIIYYTYLRHYFYDGGLTWNKSMATISHRNNLITQIFKRHITHSPALPFPDLLKREHFLSLAAGTTSVKVIQQRAENGRITKRYGCVHGSCKP